MVRRTDWLKKRVEGFIGKQRPEREGEMDKEPEPIIALQEDNREYKSRISELVETVDFLKEENTTLKDGVKGGDI